MKHNNDFINNHQYQTNDPALNIQGPVYDICCYFSVSLQD